ncbi:hypothetical protein GQ457_03G015980 [Hibiscus cannabinus]
MLDLTNLSVVLFASLKIARIDQAHPEQMFKHSSISNLKLGGVLTESDSTPTPVDSVTIDDEISAHTFANKQSSVRIDDDNFMLWRQQVKLMIRGQGLEHFLDEDTPILAKLITVNGERSVNPAYLKFFNLLMMLKMRCIRCLIRGHNHLECVVLGVAPALVVDLKVDPDPNANYVARSIIWWIDVGIDLMSPSRGPKRKPQRLKLTHVVVIMRSLISSPGPQISSTAPVSIDPVINESGESPPLRVSQPAIVALDGNPEEQPVNNSHEYYHSEETIIASPVVEASGSSLIAAEPPINTGVETAEPVVPDTDHHGEIFSVAGHGEEIVISFPTYEISNVSAVGNVSSTTNNHAMITRSKA